MRSLMFFPAVALAIAAGGCAAKAAEPSTVRGTAALSTFQSLPLGVTAVDETGRKVTAVIGSDTRFSMALAKGHTYRLAVVSATGSVPVAFPRASGKLDATFALKTNGARIALGALRHVSAAPAGGFRVLSVQVGGGSPDAQASPGGDCADCVNDDQQTTCADGSASGSQVEDTSSDGAAGANDTTEQADGTQELAVGDQNAPDQVAGCDNQEGDNSGEQQEGQH